VGSVQDFQCCMAAYEAMCDLRLQAYRELLTRAEPILAQQREQDCLRPPHFNVFRALGHAYREVSTHSAMLAHLLDPAGSHGHGALFLQDFLNIVQAAAEQQQKSFQLPPVGDRVYLWRCRREFPLRDDLGQADVLIRGPGLLLIIENKIFASDQEAQLQRYWRYAQTEAAAEFLLPVIIYLTLDGHPPTEQSVGESPGLDERLVLLSYHDEIYQFIERHARALKAVSVAEVLRQYAELVRNLG
jgi:hypothetical protein